jgi:membrane-associated phospholipid phosphatase
VNVRRGGLCSPLAVCCAVVVMAARGGAGLTADFSAAPSGLAITGLRQDLPMMPAPPNAVSLPAAPLTRMMAVGIFDPRNLTPRQQHALAGVMNLNVPMVAIRGYHRTPLQIVAAEYLATLPPDSAASAIQHETPLVAWDGRLHFLPVTRVPVAAGAALLLATDQNVTEPWFNKHIAGQRWAKSLANATNDLGGWEGIAIVGGLYLLGDSKGKQTAKLALSAVAGAALTTEALKTAFGRMRPFQSRDSDFVPFSGSASMPSGHSAQAFALATVMAHQYPKHKWLYYALAAATAFARVQKQQHFLSDVFVGGAIGIDSAHEQLEDGAHILNWRF